MGNATRTKDAKIALAKYIKLLKNKSNATKLKSLTVSDIAREVGIPRSSLYKYHRTEIEEIQNILQVSGYSSNRKLLNAARRKNKILKDKNRILTTIAHAYFMENEKLKSKLATKNRNNLTRIK